MQYELNLEKDIRCATCYRIVAQKDAVWQGKKVYCNEDCKHQDPFNSILARNEFIGE